ncbi:MAG: ergothioneine biosynthesis protein EgtB [Labilithrix sp.]|nr:ergothioneine biosynthesis protein EgtB [Labilithrix sp.]MBX3220835.1 ergothioneine biosynthesis protein EgtB [Labilithrix sp.]
MAMTAGGGSSLQSGLVARVLATRRATMRLTQPLEVEDWVVQSMPDASPVKWHLAHTTWFFERFVLRPLGVPPVVDAYDYLFNSYYESVGARHPRARRGLLTRPTAAEIISYRSAIDERLAALEGSPRLGEVAEALELGKNHEEQHQELLLTDVKHLFGANPLAPAYRAGPVSTTPSAGESSASSGASASSWHRFDGGLTAIGHEGASFAFDNERPRHEVLVASFELASRLVTCGEYLAFIEDGGYARPELWLSDGWAWVNAERQRAPAYWDLDARTVFTLRGKRGVEPSEPVCHVTFYEADAYARWAGARLPREAEWEVAAERCGHGRTRGIETAAQVVSRCGAFMEDEALHPQAARGGPGVAQLLGDAWEWTQSAYAPYPGFAPLPGAFGEYNGKFMVSQMVLRGGSCATPQGHVRATYRNFFPPSAAWQFTGIRLARDIA